MPGDPEARDEYVAFEQGQRPTLYDPGEAEALALSLLGAAQEARAYRLVHDSDERDGGSPGNGREEAEGRRIA